MSWFTQSPTPELVTIVLSPHNIACGWIQQSKHNQPLTLRAYERTPLHGYLDAHTIFNATALGNLITAFLIKHRIKNPSLSCAFASPLVTERLTTKTHATPDPSSLIMTHTQHTLWDYYYLYPTDNDAYVFYVCAVTQPLLLQYKLMAINHQLPIATTTSQTAALLHLYRYIHAHTFRASQLGIDMQQCNNTPERLFNTDILHRIITSSTLSHITPTQEASFLLTMCGLFVSEGIQ